MSPRSALAESLFESDVPVGSGLEVVSERTQAARIVFDRLPIETVPAFPVGQPPQPLRLVPLPVSVAVPMPAEVAAPGARLRLTLRGRVVLIVLAALLFSGVGVLAKAATSSASGPAVGHSQAMITVQPGDTLWSIATHVAPNADPRGTVQRIVDLNGMSSTAIASGEQLKLPS
jgi:hypothetical protein